MLSDRALGNVLQVAIVLGYAYYVVWMFGTPFVNQNHFILSFFPAREWGVIVPSLLVTLIVTLAFSIISVSAIATAANTGCQTATSRAEKAKSE